MSEKTCRDCALRLTCVVYAPCKTGCAAYRGEAPAPDVHHFRARNARITVEFGPETELDRAAYFWSRLLPGDKREVIGLLEWMTRERGCPAFPAALALLTAAGAAGK